MAHPVFVVTLTCSDRDCALEVVESVSRLEEVELLVCEGCGCCLQAVGFAEGVELDPLPGASLAPAA